MDEILISRLPVIDRELRVKGYRVAYATAELGEPTPPDGKLLIDVLSAIGLGDLIASGPVHVVVSGGLLETVGLPPITPERAVLRIAYEAAADPRLSDAFAGLCEAGYQLALSDLPGPGFEDELFRCFSVVEVDFATWDEVDAALALSRIAAAGRTPLADGLTHYSDFEVARALGYELFFGSFFTAPRITAGWHAPVGDLASLASVANLGGASIEELEQVIDRDLGLSVRLLRYINSAYFGMRGEITSIRQAVMMLGSNGVTRWALLVALAGGRAASPELTVMALTRARMCERLALDQSLVPSDTMFTVGLLSLADALLDLPLDDVVAELPLADEVAQALLWRSGPAGEILKATTAFEQGDFEAGSLKRFLRVAAREYRDSLRWANDTLAIVA